ncbi:hypothetical protein [Agrobacterium pusense]|uniref:hypothetical protein n=1 Tax=Agrobacterium pusense TaxID=648995 RepID=UPI000ADF8495|nr:hypothetical protein [Agrobacterium pusense]
MAAMWCLHTAGASIGWQKDFRSVDFMPLELSSRLHDFNGAGFSALAAPHAARHY